MTCQVVGGENICTKFLHVSIAVRNCAGFEGPEGDEVFEQEGSDDQLDDDSLPGHKSRVKCIQV